MFYTELRWIVRDGEKILQQKCARDFTDEEWATIIDWKPGRELPTSMFEWRDVPEFIEVQGGETTSAAKA